MRGQILPLALVASCGFAHAHPRALTATAIVTISTGLATLPFVTDCTSQPGDHCTRTALEAAGVGFAVGVLVAAIVSREIGLPQATPPPPTGGPPRWTPPPDDGLGTIVETPPSTATPTLPKAHAGQLTTLIFGGGSPRGQQAEGVGASMAEACAAAKRGAYDQLLETCVRGAASVSSGDGDCWCVETDDGRAACSTAADATCAHDERRVAFGSGSASSRTVAEALAIENVRARCGEFREVADSAPATCADQDDQWVCVAIATCRSAARAVP